MLFSFNAVISRCLIEIRLYWENRINLSLCFRPIMYVNFECPLPESAVAFLARNDGCFAVCAVAVM